MLFNVTLRQSFLYEDVIEANSKQEAVNIARKQSAHNEICWAPEGRLRLIDVEEAYTKSAADKLTDEDIEDLTSCLTDMVMDFVFGEGDEDDDFGIAIEPENS